MKPVAQLFWLCLFCLMTGCAPVRTTGSFIERPPSKAMRAIAADAAQQLGLIYPPAHTQLSFAHPTDDGFGRSLITELRTLGFAVAAPPARGSQLSVTYVIDKVEPLYRLLLRVASPHRKVVLARAYTYRDEALRAAGTWTQQVGP